MTTDKRIKELEENAHDCHEPQWQRALSLLHDLKAERDEAEAAVMEIGVLAKKMWNDDECGWLTSDPEDPVVECVKCGALGEDVESVLHNEGCSQVDLFSLLGIVRRTQERKK